MTELLPKPDGGVVPVLRTCRRCGETKPVSRFYPDRHRSDGIHLWCRDCALASTKAWNKAHPAEAKATREKYRRNNPERYFEATVLRAHNLTFDQYAAMLAEQGGVCAICKQRCTFATNLAVDHDHRCCPTQRRSCGKCVRGLLCRRCNQGLGQLGDTAAGLRTAFAYLESAEERLCLGTDECES